MIPGLQQGKPGRRYRRHAGRDRQAAVGAFKQGDLVFELVLTGITTSSVDIRLDPVAVYNLLVDLRIILKIIR